MALSTSDVYSPQAPGLATVLGSGLNPLRVLQQEEYRRQAREAAAARLKQQQEAADARNVVPLDANGWLPHNDELTAAVQAGYEKQKQIYADPTKSAFQKKAEAQQIANSLKQQADRSNELNARYKTTIGLAADPRYNKAALETGAYNTFFQTDPTTGEKKALPLAQYDPSALDNAAMNPAYFNRDKVLQTFIKAEADKESVRLSKAAPLGGYGVNRQASSDIFDVNPDGTLAINRDGSYKIRDINALVQRAHNDPFMAAILRDNAQKAQQGAGADVMASYGELTPEQRATLNGLPAAAPAERADLATMLADYGKVKSSSVQTYRVPWRPREGSKPKNPPVYSAPVEEEYQVPGEVAQPGTQQGVAPLPFAANPTGSDTFGALQSAAVPKSPQQGFYSNYTVPAPVHATASGQNKPYQTDTNGVVFSEKLVKGEDGRYHNRKNISTPTVGSFGVGISLPINRQTGEPLTPEDGAAYERALRDPNNEARSYVQIITPKNKNFSAEYQQRFEELKKERNRQQGGDILGKGKYSTDSELADKAREDATGETTVEYVPNYGQNARLIDGLTSSSPKANYRAHREGVAGHQARVRATAPAKAARPSFLKTKNAGPAPTQPAARKTGGMFD